MGYKIVIYKDNKFYKEENLQQNWENFIYKWGNVESGSYFFEIKNICFFLLIFCNNWG